MAVWLALTVPLALVAASSSNASAAAALPPLPAGFVSTPTPANGSFTVTGRAWGHRIGMSQVGAQYAGRAGVTAPAILAHYYPGTALTTVARARWATTWRGTSPTAARPVLRVKLEANTGASVVVTVTRGLSLSVQGRLIALPVVPATSQAPARWRLVPVSGRSPVAGLRTQFSTSATSNSWTSVGPVLPLGSGFATSVPASGVRMVLANGTTRTEPTAVVLTTDGPSSSSWRTVSYVDLQTYVGVVTAAEIGPSSSPATLAAQAVAARTYATRLAVLYGATHSWDVCSVSCQYYPGVATGSLASGPTRDRSRVFSSTVRAAAATTDQVLTYRGAVILTMFAAANGGYTVSGHQPYLPAQPDPWDTASGSSSSRWSATLPASALTPLLPKGDRLTAIALGGRDGHGDLGGPATVVLLDSVSPTGELHRTQTTPGTLRSRWSWPTKATGLRSTWFAFTSPSTPAATGSGGRTTAPVPSTTAPAILLKYGSRGSSVVTVQRVLRVSPTGFYGTKTRAAVTTYQRTHRLPATGIVDTRTWKALTARSTPGAAHATTSTTIQLKYGSRGSSVVTVQRTLRVSPTGFYGTKTRAAVTTFQRTHRLPATGIVDTRTWHTLTGR